MRRECLSRLAWAVALVGLTSCASDGGPIGSGISASVVGNVVDVAVLADPSATLVRRAQGDQGLQPIEVRIDEFSDAVTHTDADGNFELRGDFQGALTLRFVTTQFEASRAVTVPAGSVVALTDIELSPDDVEVQAERALDFIAVVDVVECDAARLQVHDLGNADEAYDVALLAETQFERLDGEPAACADITPGARIAIDGALQPDAPLEATALRVIIGQSRPARPALSRSVPFLGRAVAVDCAAGVIAIDDGENRLRVRVSSSTAITRPNRNPIACTDIQLGDQVAGVGTLRLVSPGVIRASTLVVSRRTRPDVELRFVGFLTHIDCASGILELLYQGSVTAVRLSPRTVITPPLECADLRLGDRVAGAGEVLSDDPDRIAATRLHVKRPLAPTFSPG